MQRTMVLLGGGEIRNKETLAIDRYIADLAKQRAGDRRAVALFIGTAGHDFMPYYNSFHKTYTGELGLKTDVALTVFQQTDEEKLNGKFEKADVIYVGGGDTVFMLESWKQTGLLDKIKAAYERGVILCGLSAGAICWFQKMYTDSSKNGDEKYRMEQGLGLLSGGCCPHYDHRKEDFSLSCDKSVSWTCLENNAAVVYHNEQLMGALGEGNCYTVTFQGDLQQQTQIIKL